MEIRRLADDDWVILKEARLQALSESPEAFGSTYEREVAFADDEWRQRVHSYAWFAAFQDGSIVGLAAGAECTEDTRRLVAMWASPAVRGTGAAAALVEAVTGWARELGADALCLDVAEDNERARRFYVRLGFQPTGGRQPFRGRDDLSKEELQLALRTKAVG